MFLKKLFDPDDEQKRREVFLPPPPVRMEQRDVERCFARCFSTQDGQKVLAHLQVITFQRAQGPDASDERLRHAEGQRALMGSVLRLIDRGRRT